MWVSAGQQSASLFDRRRAEQFLRGCVDFSARAGAQLLVAPLAEPALGAQPAKGGSNFFLSSLSAGLNEIEQHAVLNGVTP